MFATLAEVSSSSASLEEFTSTTDAGVMRPPIDLAWERISNQVRVTLSLDRQFEKTLAPWKSHV